ncbi:MAG: hypothetical protein HFH47_01010 [Bacilli bacterium]|nr:hypothetical protein [Bacilli bacterium]
MKINEALKIYSLVPNRYEKNGKANIVDTNNGRFVFKESKIDSKILNYLKSRNFDYMPKFINDIRNEEYQLTEYIEGFDIPKEQKILDLILLVSLLHSKTTHYKEIDLNDFEEIYNDIDNNLNYLYGYYTDIITLIESKVFMSPSEYLLARNITKIYDSIDNCKDKLETWHDLIQNKRKQRNVVLHNNLNLDHFVRNEISYLISWDKAKIGSPVFDIYKLYRKHALDFDFEEILKEYETHYPLMEDERSLLFVLISMPNLIEFNDTEYNMCIKISKEIDMLYKAEALTTKIA